MPNAKPPKITIEPVKVDTDPQTHVFQIVVEGEHGVWQETVNTEREARYFLKGMQAMASFCGMIGMEVPPVPQEPQF